MNATRVCAPSRPCSWSPSSRSSRSCSRSCSRSRRRASRSCATQLAASYDDEGRGFVLVRVAGGYRYQSHPDLARLRRAVRARGPERAPVGRRARDARDRRVQAADLARADRGHPRRRRRRRDPHAAEPRLRRPSCRAIPDPGQAVLFGTTTLLLEKLGIDSLDDLPPLGEYVPGADVVEQLETGLRPSPTVADRLLDVEATNTQRDAETKAPDRPRPRADRRADARRVTDAEPTGERLQKVLARAGIASRRASEELIAAGRVRVNGAVAELGPARRRRARRDRGRRHRRRRPQRSRALPAQQARAAW